MKYIARAPGRINLIGEHTDYNQGFVLPGAVNLTLVLELELQPGRIVQANALDFNETISFSLDEIEPPAVNINWADYIKGVCWSLEKNGYPIGGANLKFSSKIPIGAGLSSSAALELAFAGAINKAHGLNISHRELALLCQEAENDFVGVRCGIMDQFAVALARKDHALFIDCRSLTYENIYFPLNDYSLLIVDSRVERSLAASAYNQRREECEEAVRLLSKLTGRELEALRDVNIVDVERYSGQMPGIIEKRARFVVEENMRVLRAVEALKEMNYPALGDLMNRSHQGLRRLFEVSSQHLDLIVDLAQTNPGVLGARMTGAGFGGCAIILLETGSVSGIKKKISREYEKRFGFSPFFYLTALAGGLGISEKSKK